MAMAFADLVKVANMTPYPVDAFLFVQRGLDFTVRRIHGELQEAEIEDVLSNPDNASRHVSGEELCWGLRDFAIQQYGLLARTLLKRWHIRESADFGHIVFAMVENNLMLKTDDDTIEDFRNIFDFDEVFSKEAIELNAT